MKFVQNFNGTTLAVTQREFAFLKLKTLIFWQHSFNFCTLFIVYNLNYSYFIYKNYSKFQKKHFGCNVPFN